MSDTLSTSDSFSEAVSPLMSYPGVLAVEVVKGYGSALLGLGSGVFLLLHICDICKLLTLFIFEKHRVFSHISPHVHLDQFVGDTNDVND